MHTVLFPDFKDVPWALLNLDAQARRFFTEEHFPDNPLVDPEVCDRWVFLLHKMERVRCSYGGYLEDRSHLWRQHYHPPGKFIHLGIDFNVPPGHPVVAFRAGTVVESWVDPDTQGGWGTRVILQAENGIYDIYAHLSMAYPPSPGEFIKAGGYIGRVGFHHNNGGWYPHLHVQCVRGVLPPDLDGYAIASPDLEERYPSPQEQFNGSIVV